MAPMERDDLAAWLRLQNTPGIGNINARKLLAAFGTPQNIFLQGHSHLAEVVGPAPARALLALDTDQGEAHSTCWNWLQQAPDCHRIVPLGTPLYPRALLHLADAPLLLYAMAAETTWAQNCINQPDWAALAVVGTRNPSVQGGANAQQFAHALAQAGLTIVSGLALGIDGMAHEGALQACDGAALATIAVVGTGLDRVYPRQHRELAHRIGQNGMLLSEYALGIGPLPHNFPRRNRIIAALSLGTLVVEAALKSGSLITAQLAAEQGKEVFAIPGSIHSAQARGCHALLREGAKLVECAQDILEELPGWRLRPPCAAPALRAEGHSAEPESPLLQALGYAPISLDTLQQHTGLTTAALQAQLMELELMGHIVRMPGGNFQRLAGT